MFLSLKMSFKFECKCNAQVRRSLLSVIPVSCVVGLGVIRAPNSTELN